MFKKGHAGIKYWKGKKLSEATKRKLSEAHKGQIPWAKGKHWKVKDTSNMGVRGERNGAYKDGRSQNADYISWRKNKRNRQPKTGNHTFVEWETLKARYNWTCPCCLKSEPEVKLTQDHIIPLSKGGTDNIENIQPLCQPCNSKKSIKIITWEIANPSYAKEIKIRI